MENKLGIFYFFESLTSLLKRDMSSSIVLVTSSAVPSYSTSSSLGVVTMSAAFARTSSSVVSRGFSGGGRGATDFNLLLFGMSSGTPSCWQCVRQYIASFTALFSGLPHALPVRHPLVISNWQPGALLFIASEIKNVYLPLFLLLC